ncbi:MAG: PIN domain-containing protein [Ferruginibacter sp.]
MKRQVIVDTSVWIDFFRGLSIPPVLSLMEIMDSNALIILPVIAQEVLQGVREKKMVDMVESLLFGFQFISYDSYEAALGAAELYRKMRSKGITVRSSNDALIAWLCIYFNLPVLHIDRDFDNIAKYTSLKIYK